jgi:hypothetical protein
MRYYSGSEHAYENSEHFHVQIFVNIYLCIRVLVSLHNEILHKSDFGQVHYVDLTKMSLTKFSLPFVYTPTSFYEFWKFANISRIK